MPKVRLKPAFTIAEAMLAVVILSIASAGVILPFSSGAALETEGTRLALASALASNLMEVIASKPPADPDSETPADFDDIDDYDGCAEAAGAIKDSSGALITHSEYSAFARSVTCDPVYLSQQSGLLPATCFCVTITIDYNGRQIARISRIISK